MRRRYSRALAGAAALAAAALAVFALRPSPKTVTLAARNPVVEVRTVVIRRTIHIVKHAPTVGASGTHAAGPGGVAHAGGPRARTGASGSHRTASAGPGVSTRTSGSHAGGAPAGAPVTRASGSHSGSTGAPVATRTSGASGGSAGKPVSTRTSGGGGGGGNGGDGGDGGDGGGGDN